MTLLLAGLTLTNSDMTRYSPNFHETIHQLISDSSDIIKNGAAYCLGHLALSNVDIYLPVMMDAIKSGKQRYYYIVAVNEMVSRFIFEKRVSLHAFQVQLWDLLLQVVQDSEEEGINSLISDCIGKLLLNDAPLFLSRLVELLTSPQTELRVTAVGAFRYTISRSSVEFEKLVYPLVGSFFEKLQDPSVQVRKMALTALSSAIHSKPILLNHVLSDVIPLLYQETTFKVVIYIHFTD